MKSQSHERRQPSESRAKHWGRQGRMFESRKKPVSTAGPMHTTGLCKGGLSLRTRNTGLLRPKKLMELGAGPERCKTPTPAVSSEKRLPLTAKTLLLH